MVLNLWIVNIETRVFWKSFLESLNIFGSEDGDSDICHAVDTEPSKNTHRCEVSSIIFCLQNSVIILLKVLFYALYVKHEEVSYLTLPQ